MLKTRVRTSPRPLLAWLASVGVLLLPVAASAVDGPGLGNLTYSSGQVNTRLSTINSPHGNGNVAILNGYLMTIYSSDGGGSPSDGGIEFWNVSNPASPQLHIRYDNADTHGLREAHGFGFSTSYGADVMVAQAHNGIQFWDMTNPDAISLIKYMTLPGISAGDYTGDWWTFFQAPYVYVAGTNQGLYVVDATDPANPVLVNQIPSSAIAGINPGVVYAQGNLLVLMRNQDDGYATFDISNPANPVLIATVDSGFKGYSHLFAGGKILVSGGNGGSNTMGVYDVTHAGAMASVGQAPTSCGGFLQNFDNGGYGSVQDGFFFSGFSNRIGKFNIATRTIAACMSANISGADQDFAQVVGNLVWMGNDHTGSALIVHQAAPDTTGANVTWVHPQNGAINQALTSRVGISLSDMVGIDSVNSTSFIVRPVGGSALPGKYSVAKEIANFSPDAPLVGNTTYEVVVNGIKDVVGNAGGSFTSTFTTGNFVPPSCTLAALTPSLVNTSVNFTPQSVSGPGPISYSWDFGDGSPPTTPSATPGASHTFTSPERRGVVLSVSNAYGASGCSATQIVHNPLTPTPATASSPIVHDGTRSFNVNPDSDTVAAISESSLTELWEAPVGDDPKTLAVAPGGNVWVVNRGSSSISVLDPASGALLQTIALPANAEPYGIAFAPDGSSAYVTLDGTGRLLRLSTAGAITGNLDVGPRPRGIAISGDSSRILVTRFISPATQLTDPADPGTLVLPEGEVREVDAASFTVVRTFPLAFDFTLDTEANGRGVPNYLTSIRISPDGVRAVVPSKKDNVARGQFLDAQPLTFESRVRTILSELDLVGNAENFGARIDFNDRDMAQSALFSPLGDLVFVGLQGTNLVEVRNANQPTQLVSVVATGRAPQGLALDVDGLGRTLLYVHNFMARSVSIFDASALMDGTGNGMPLLAEVSTVANEALSPTVLLGKRIFYNAADNRMNRDGYLSCASCHLNGDNDGQNWDFTQAGEGLRNTVELVGRGGMGHGNVHWTANFDEIQDFENDIRGAFSGLGFLTDPDFANTSNPLGTPKAGLSADLDALAAYVSSLDRFPVSPYRNPDGTLTADGVAGKGVFDAHLCGSCHVPFDFTDGLRHDVGTIQVNSGQGIGQPLAGVGIDTPTLRSLWKTAPYLHNGQAGTLADVLENTTHVGALTAPEKTQLVAYLLQIDALAPSLCSNGLDDDSDGNSDFPADPGCSNAASNDESPQCSDGVDNDGDTLVDHPADPGCSSAADDNEVSAVLPACSDGLDNDGDGLVDLADPGCGNVAANPSESPGCGLVGIEGFVALAALGALRRRRQRA